MTPLFNILADDHATSPGNQSFSCDGLGDNNQELLKDILNKIIASYPTKPIRLCLSGSEIVPDAQSAAVPAGRPLDGVSSRDALAPAADGVSPRSLVKATAKKAAPKKAEHKYAAAKHAAAKKAASKAADKKVAAKKAAAKAADKKTTAKKATAKKGALKATTPKNTGAKTGGRRRAPKKRG